MTRGGRWVMWTVVGVGVLCASSVYRRPFATLRSINRRLLLLTGVAERTASVHGVPMRYFEAGGPGRPGDAPIVLVCGLGDSAESWGRVIRPLSRGRRVLAPDLAGFGRNPVPPEGMNFSALVRYLGGFLDELGVERAVLVGSSLGGAVVIRYAARYPERVHRLFLLNSAGLLKELAPSFEPTDRETAQELVDIIGGPRLRLPRFILDDLLRETGAPARREYLRSTERTDVSEDLPKIVAPTTIIWGDRDRLIPLDNGERLHAGIEGSELIVLPGVGHGPHVDAARRVVEIIREWLQGDGATAAQSPRLNSGRIASRPYPDGGQ